VEGHGHSSGSGHQHLGDLLVDGAIGAQRTNHHTMATGTLAKFDVANHTLHLSGGVDKVAATWTYQHVHLDATEGYGRTDQARRRRDAAFAQSGTKFHTVSATAFGSYGRLNVATTDFQYLIHVFEERILLDE
jgi:hypothetical protein